MGQHRQTAEDTHENLRELLDWQFAERNDQAVAQALYSGARRRYSLRSG